MSIDTRIAFIGGGNMARSLISGRLRQGCMADISAVQLELLRKNFLVRTAAVLAVLEAAKLREIFPKALTAAHDHSRQISIEFGKDPA